MIAPIGLLDGKTITLARNTRSLNTAYIHECWDLRYFVFHLAVSDIRQRYRKSFIGALWVLLMPVALTLMMTFVMSAVFSTSPGSYSTYVLAGLVAWDFIVQCAIGGGNTFLSSEGYIKQYNRPLLLYVLRTVLTNSLSLILGSVGLICWALVVNDSQLSATSLALVAGWLVAIITAVPLAGLFGFMTTRYRDFGQITILGFQMIWYLSPVFITENAFRSSEVLTKMLEYNPVYHYLQFYRSPLLLDAWPTITNFSFALIPALILWPLFLWRLKANEKNLIYYL